MIIFTKLVDEQLTSVNKLLKNMTKVITTFILVF